MAIDFSFIFLMKWLEMSKGSIYVGLLVLPTWKVFKIFFFCNYDWYSIWNFGSGVSLNVKFFLHVLFAKIKNLNRYNIYIKLCIYHICACIYIFVQNIFEQIYLFYSKQILNNLLISIVTILKYITHTHTHTQTQASLMAQCLKDLPACRRHRRPLYMCEYVCTYIQKLRVYTSHAYFSTFVVYMYFILKQYVVSSPLSWPIF